MYKMSVCYSTLKAMRLYKIDDCYSMLFTLINKSDFKFG